MTKETTSYTSINPIAMPQGVLKSFSVRGKDCLKELAYDFDNSVVTDKSSVKVLK